ncbi:hypothetical protein [Streptomyces sp. NPDC057686]|uniref:hypothetical protein n=1 Tax=Streptomyces sp. NPDC057686 TaxID=3346212 RepID=UPI0036A9BB1D
MRKLGRILTVLTTAAAMGISGMGGTAQADDGLLSVVLSPLLCGVQNNVNGSNNQFNQATSCQQTSTTTPPGQAGFTGYELVSSEPNTFTGIYISTTTVPCPAGKRVLGGGLTVDSGLPSLITLNASGPNPAGTAWVVSFSGDARNNDPVTFHTYATCANVGT